VCALNLWLAKWLIVNANSRLGSWNVDTLVAYKWNGLWLKSAKLHLGA